MQGHWWRWLQQGVSKFPLSKKRGKKKKRLFSKQLFSKLIKWKIQILFIFNQPMCQWIVLSGRVSFLGGCGEVCSLSLVLHIVLGAFIHIRLPTPSPLQYWVPDQNDPFYLPSYPFAIMWISLIEIPLKWSGLNPHGKFCISSFFSLLQLDIITWIIYWLGLFL